MDLVWAMALILAADSEAWWDDIGQVMTSSSSQSKTLVSEQN